MISPPARTSRRRTPLALVVIGNSVMQSYATAKARQAALDFDDLVGKAASLLQSSSAVEWVLYKLDGGLDHILVDEAQDTAPRQWDVIGALAQEFFSGEGARAEVRRTVFAVGDEKQSIYGFQGAAPEQFAHMGRALGELVRTSGQTWNEIPLTLSFRTTAPILDAVDRIFSKGHGTAGVARGEGVRHVASRIGAAGLVELWPTEKADKAEPAEVWEPFKDATPPSPVARLADHLNVLLQVKQGADSLTHYGVVVNYQYLYLIHG